MESFFFSLSFINPSELQPVFGLLLPCLQVCLRGTL